MYTIRLANSSKHIAANFSSTAAEALFLAVEANYKNPAAYTTARMEQIRHALKRSAEEVPWTDEYLWRVVDDLSRLASGCLFMGFILREGNLSLCTAGDLRLHIVVGSEITFVSRVHNLIEDVPPGIYKNIESLDRTLRMNTITRCLGQTRSAPPERVHVEVSEGASIVVASSLIHRFEPPNAYTFALLAGDDSRIQEWEGLSAVVTGS